MRRGRITTEWSQARQRLRATYRNGDFARAVAISAAQSSSKAAYANGHLSFEIELGPGERSIPASYTRWISFNLSPTGEPNQLIGRHRTLTPVLTRE